MAIVKTENTMQMYKICEIEDCERIVGLHGAKGMCPLHYRRFRVHGDPLFTKYNNPCKVESCERNRASRNGYCQKHNKRYLNGFDPQLPSKKEKRQSIDMGDHALIPIGVLAKDGYAIVDNQDKDIDKHLWSKDNAGYAQTNIKGKIVKMHHLIIGKPKKPLVTDHINRNKMDNRRINLRVITERENALNKRYTYDGNTEATS